MILTVDELNKYNYQGLLYICKNNRDLFAGYNRLIRHELMEFILKTEDIVMPVMKVKHYLILKKV